MHYLKVRTRIVVPLQQIGNENLQESVFAALPLCGQGFMKRTGSSWSVDLRSMTLDEFAKWLNFGLDRLVFDKTGLTAKYDFHLGFSADQSTPGFLLGGTEAGDTPDPV